MALIVKLNGSNYVSDKTKAAFAQALTTGQVSESANQPMANGEWRMVNGEWQMADEQESESARKRVNEPTTTNYGLDNTQYAVRSTPVNLEQGLTHAYEQQQTTARVHEQYLAYQAEYAQLYAQLLQQQGAIFGGVNGDSRKAELAAQVLETLAQSMARFHELQAETLNVHKQFLGQQADTSQTYMRLMVNGESGNGEWRMTNGRVSESANQRESESASKRVSEKAAPVQNQKSEIENPVTQYAGRSTDAPSAQVPTLTLDAGALHSTLLAIVSDKTGYPAEMLEPEMDMEADLGIDSIKRVEIMGALREAYPALPKTDPEVFAELRTLGQIIAYASERVSEKANGEWRMTNDAAPATTTDYELRTSNSKKA